MPEIHHDQLYDPAAAGSIGQSEQIGGPRKYEGQGLGPVVSWNCPACGKPNSRPLSEGCEFCHSGEGAAKHVGVDPIVRKGEKKAPESEPTYRTYPGQPTRAITDADLVFTIWAQVAANFPMEMRHWVRVGFLAGWNLRGTKLHDSVTMKRPLDATNPPPQSDDKEIPPTEESEPTTLEGTIEARTIVAALQLFKAQVLDEGPEEVGTGEWLGATAIDELIEDVKRRYA